MATRYAIREPFYADTFGTPFKAYYCANCAAPALELQNATKAVR